MPAPWMAAIPDALVMIDAAGVVRDWSLGAERMYGYAHDEAVGVPLGELIVPAQRLDEQRRLIAQTLQRGAGIFETLRRCKDGSMIHVDISSTVVPSDAADAMRLVLSEKDVTGLKVLRDARSLDARYRELLESTPDGIVMVAETGHILIANSQAERLFGYGPDELLARPVEMLLPERLRGAHRGHRSRYFSLPRTRAMGVGLELFGLRKDGSEFPVEISLSPLRTEELPVVMSAIRDVSERKRFEQALQDKNVELENANRAKDRFLASMSHELRTPLNAVIGFTGTLLMKLPGELNAEQARQLEIVRSNARQLLALINDLLHLARIEAGKVELQLQPTDCAALVAEVVATLRPQAEARQLDLSVRIPRPSLMFRTDARAFSQIVLNLTSNAIKFTERGSVCLQLSETEADGRRQLALSVTDSGPGICQQDMAALFEPFMQGQASRRNREDGTGLGLHLSRKLAELLGGSLTCHSVFGSGSVFTLRLTEA